ncbi:MAG: phosphoenolpyruvate--protein phosphotransferase [Verrucomicrobiota bacterium]
MGSQPSLEEEHRFSGIPVSPGIAIGPIAVNYGRFEAPPAHPISPSRVDEEKSRFQAALGRTRQDLLELQKEIATTIKAQEAAIFEAHLLVVEDPTIVDEVLRRLEKTPTNVEAIFYDVIHEQIESLRALKDAYFRERATDVEDVAHRILRHLTSSSTDLPQINPDEPHIVFAEDLTPSDTVTMNRQDVLGFATVQGSYTSHTAIMARSLNIPGVVGLEMPDDFRLIEQKALIDGYSGCLILNPSSETLAEYQAIQTTKGELAHRLDSLRDANAATEDGQAITLSANIEFGQELKLLHEYGAAGVGLYRTEFFFFREPTFPDEEAQTANYSALARDLDPDGIIIRTLDIGGDKLPSNHTAKPEPNPFLGWRGIRMSLQRPRLFKTQLRAALRAGAAGKVRLMYPMISGLEELRQANNLVAECKQELADEGTPHDENLEIGCIIELPSAAMMADVLAREVDFISVGTNDLIQYTVAVDRVNERVASLYQPANPAIVRFLKRIVDAAHDAGIWAGVCGEMAGDPLYTPLLVGMGYDELSVGTGQILPIKHALHHLDSTLCRDLVDQALTLDNTDSILGLCREMSNQRYPELF